MLAAFHFTHALDNHLLRGLRGNAAEINRRQRVHDEFAKLNARLDLLRDAQGDLRGFILNRFGFHHFGEAVQLHAAILAVNGRADVLLKPVFGATGFLDRLFHGFQHFLTLDHFLARDGIGHLQQFRTGNGDINGHGAFSSMGHTGWGGGLRRRRDQFIGQHQLGAADIAARQGNFAAIIKLEPRFSIIRAKGDATKPLAAIHRDRKLHRCDMAGEAVPIFGARQRAINPGRGYFQHPLTPDRVRDIQHRAHGMADGFAIIHGEGRFIGAVRHDLHHGAFLAGNLHAHQFIAKLRQAGQDRFRDAGFKPFVMRQIRLQKQKRRPLSRPPPVSSDGVIASLIAFGGQKGKGSTKPGKMAEQSPYRRQDWEAS